MDELTLKRGRHVCAARDCRNTPRNCTYGFYRFSSDPTRAEAWAIAAGREDLVAVRDTLNKSHRLCGAHFESKMFIRSNNRRLLLAQAVPTLFPSMGRSSSGVLKEHGYFHSVNVQRISPEIQISSDTDTKNNFSQESSQVGPAPKVEIPRNILISPALPEADVPDPEPDTSVFDRSFEAHFSSASTQTPKNLSASSPRKQKLKKEIKNLKKHCGNIERQVDIYTGTKREELLKSITLKEFTALTYKFCPDRPDLAKFINAQLTQLRKKTK